MKNFSVKTADFDSLSISGESPIVQSDLGTAPNQIPLNKDLGSLAYMNAPQIEDLNVDTLELREIAAELSETAVDVFVYDTRKDSDGGAWRSRTQHTSWYNEELNTATRGGRREFPAVAVIVAETNKVTIYDGDDPDLPMWMVFNADVAGKLLNTIGGNTSLAALNGDIFVGCNEYDNGGVSIKIAFISDTSFAYADNQITQWPTGISGRDLTVNYTIFVHSYGLVNLYVNDVAMTVLPNAPIDDNTGLPIPTIAVATDGGVSVIKDDGSVVDITLSNASYNYSHNVDFDLLNVLSIGFGHPSQASYGYLYKYNNVPSGDTVITINTKNATGAAPDYFASANSNVLFSNVNTYLIGQGIVNVPVIDISENAIASTKGLNLLYGDNTISHVTSSYNTGWMPGDIKLATLSDTKIEKVGETTELLTNGTFDADDTSGWTLAGSPVIAFSTSGVIDVTGDGEGLYQDLAPGTYLVSVGTISGTGGEVRFIDLDSSTILFSASQSGDSLVITSVGNLRVYIRAFGNNLASFDNISVRQTGELITNGTFDNGTTGWSSDGATLSVVSGKLRVTNTAANGEAYLGFPTEIGKKYLFTAELTSGTSGAAYYLSNDAPNDYTGNLGFEENVNGVRIKSFMASSAITYIRLENTSSLSGEYSEYDNISVRFAEPDRSVNDNGLQIFGEIDKTPVAPGADLVAYSGFSADDYLVQPYNSDLDFTDTMFAAIWLKDCIAAVNVFDRGTRYTNHSYGLYFDAGNDLRFYYSSDGTTDQRIEITDGQLDMSSGWHFACVSIDAGAISLYIDGVLRNTGTLVGNFYSQATDQNPLKIGPGSVSGQAWGTMKSALFRISATAPTAEQIAKIYRDEKPLFQDGAQATLYGTSDAVTALAYDDSENLLHVGSASGRSSFNGLKRVDNTTTAVTTAISATEGLVIEQ